MKEVRRLRYTRALRSRKGLWLIRLDKMDKKDKDYDGDDKHSVTNDNPAQERADIKESRALKTNLSDCQIKYMGHFGSVVHTI